jgi:hypothetical protein
LQAVAAAEAARPAEEPTAEVGETDEPTTATDDAGTGWTLDESDLETTRSLTAPDPDRTRVIQIQADQTRSISLSGPAPAQTVAGHPDQEHVFDPDRTRSFAALDPDQTQAIPLGDPNRARALREVESDRTQVIAFDPDRTRDLSGAMPDPDRTQIIRLHPPGEPGGQVPGPGEQRNMPYPGTGDVGGDETQVIRLSGRPARPSYVEPPGDRTQVFQVQTNSTTESRPGTPTSIAGAERPAFSEDPTSRIVPPDLRAEDDRPVEAPKRPRTVMDMERPPDEEDEVAGHAEIPAQRRPTTAED